MAQDKLGIKAGGATGLGADADTRKIYRTTVLRENGV